VSFLSGGNWTSDPRERSGQEFVRLGRTVRSDRLADATIACPHCDAPVAIGPDPITVEDRLTCPFCGHHGPVRGFLSLSRPTRPTHVVLRVSFGEAR
jgi:DNA-directed RNA polymerase subunit RPC12/RpoP